MLYKIKCNRSCVFCKRCFNTQNFKTPHQLALVVQPLQEFVRLLLSVSMVITEFVSTKLVYFVVCFDVHTDFLEDLFGSKVMWATDTSGHDAVSLPSRSKK